MSRRDVLRRAGAGVLIGIAMTACMRAAIVDDVRPVPGDTAVVSRSQLALRALRHRPVVASGMASESVAVVPPGRPAIRVPILMYHYIRVNPDPQDRLGFGLSVTPDDFRRQMDWLDANGFHPVDLNDVRAYLLGQDSLPARPIVLTFDDGYRDMYTTAFPILRAHRFKAVSYVVSGFIGSPSNVTPDQVLEMDANGIQIASHTVSHADLTRLSPADLRHEVFDSKTTLEALLGHPVLDFCYPSGRVDDAVVQAVATAGYQTATTTQPGVLHSAGDRYLWTRVRVAGGESLEEYAAALGDAEAPVTVSRPRSRPSRGEHHLPITFPLRTPSVQEADPPSEAVLP